MQIFSPYRDMMISEGNDFSKMEEQVARFFQEPAGSANASPQQKCQAPGFFEFIKYI